MATFTAHIISADAHGLGKPGIVVMRGDDPDAAPFTTFPLTVHDDPLDVLETAGWSIDGDRSTALTTAENIIEPGYYLIGITPASWTSIVADVTAERDVAEAEFARRDAAWRAAIADAVTATSEGTAIAEAAGISRPRVYQIRDGR